MELQRQDTRAGRWRLAGAPELFASLRAELERAAHQRGSARGLRTLAGTPVFLKGSALARGPALRHGLRRALFGAEIPRLQEFANLAWLRAHGFLAPRPLLAGVLERRGLPRYQFLCSEWLSDAPDLQQHLPAASPARRAELLAALARDLAGLHSLGFVHCDLFPRNLLASSGPLGPRCVFLDAWRVAPGRGRRGPEHDLACLFLEGLDARETGRFLDVYASERTRLGRPLPGGFTARLERARLAVWRRESRRRPSLPGP